MIFIKTINNNNIKKAVYKSIKHTFHKIFIFEPTASYNYYRIHFTLEVLKYFNLPVISNNEVVKSLAGVDNHFQTYNEADKAVIQILTALNCKLLSNPELTIFG
jgi:hypothetical protein